MDTERIRRRAQEIWEAEGKPEGEHERHWLQAEREQKGDGEVPQTSSSAHHSATTIPDGGGTSSTVITERDREPGSFKPGNFASENK
ncbi:DUF2934 domain-containing protein [Rhizobium hidalgonense]|uniref:DUF2934 domain-containing protein n=1 Tax=Rhizobium hidalgonense TaxID=1538159 RepID=A0A2A6K954_9HYPH|nr:DUF2934 domain-containing protein [Rhizobium hidalgonense]MDR9776003.1 DUF2934 domain-containing protein [Rhizobium hidalgonense]MDR9814106.1 DUF2934 domain-containing protein [Rhizobium hidalgonense]MDR9820810.1 DUF2934 domain-containing protein [Rhizobium hidalgonense]PDT20969.1 hypothetical protein CO674_25085 [Rhizobium hidalgonense]